MSADPEKRSKVKICGITSLEDARFVSGALADYVGFIFFEDSLRHVTPAKAGAIINWVEGPECVGVFVNQPLDDVNMISRQTGIDYVQLHGSENADYCGMVDQPVIKAIHIGKQDSPGEIESRIRPYLDVVDFLLFDTRIDDRWGGTGEVFDWSLIDDISGEIPFFLSGGLNAENVHQACRHVNPYGVDLASGLESEPGVKDFNKVTDFMGRMRSIWEQQEGGEE